MKTLTYKNDIPLGKQHKDKGVSKAMARREKALDEWVQANLPYVFWDSSELEYDSLSDRTILLWVTLALDEQNIKNVDTFFRALKRSKWRKVSESPASIKLRRKIACTDYFIIFKNRLQC